MTGTHPHPIHLTMSCSVNVCEVLQIRQHLRSAAGQVIDLLRGLFPQCNLQGLLQHTFSGPGRKAPGKRGKKTKRGEFDVWNQGNSLVPSK